MSRPRYEDDDKLIQAVMSCMARRLSNEEAVAELASKNYNISLKAYRRRKERIKEIYGSRIENMITIGNTSYLFESFELLNDLKFMADGMKKDASDFWQKRAAIQLIMQIQSEIGKYQDSASILDRFAKLESNE